MYSPSLVLVRGVPASTLLGAGAGAVAAAWLDVSSFAGYLAAALGAAVFVQLAAVPAPLRFAAPACTAAFPFLVQQGAEAGLFWGAALSFAALAIVSVLLGLRPGLLTKLAVTLLVVTYLAVLGSHLVLIRQFPDGSRIVTAFFLLTAAYLGAWSAVERRPNRKPDGRPDLASPDWLAAAAGLLAAEGAAFAARAVVPLPVDLSAVAILALVVAIAAEIGRAIGRFVSDEAPSDRATGSSGLAHLNALLVAAPAFYYGFRLYLS